jgi:hypothetical protein
MAHVSYQPYADAVPENENVLPSAYLCIELYGLRIRIGTNLPEVLGHVLPYLPFGWKHAVPGPVNREYFLASRPASHRDPTSRYVITRRVDKLAESADLRYALQALEYDLEIYVAEQAPQYVFVHAGVVGWEDRAILLPGSSHSGKSTLVAALCHAGAVYFSDEYALLDMYGRVHPYPRPLRLRQALPDVAAAEPNLIGSDSVPVGLLVLTHYRSGAFWQPHFLSSGQGALELLSNTMCAQVRPEAVLTTLGRIAASAVMIQSDRPEAGATVAPLLRLASSMGK